MAYGGNKESITEKICRLYPEVRVVEYLHEVKQKLEEFSSKSGSKTKFNKKRKLQPAQLPNCSQQSEGTLEGTDGDEDKCGDVYNFRHQKRGLAVIINNMCQLSTTEERTGSSEDVLALCPTFIGLGFDVLLCLEFSAEEMVKVFMHAADCYPHDIADCFACVIMTHGNEAWEFENEKSDASLDRLDRLFGIDQKAVATRFVIGNFTDERCPKLMNKPRLFFVQACRGSKDDKGLEIKENTVDSAVLSEQSMQVTDEDVNLDAPHGPTFPNCLPVTSSGLYPHCFVMQATPPGYRAMRNEEGSWFVQALCQVLNSHICCTTPFLQMMTGVQGIVARHYESRKYRKKQIPVVDLMLTKDIYFSKKN